VISGGSISSWTFGAFTDPVGRIASYSATLVTVTGSGTLSGSGLGPYSITGTADGDAYTVELDALDGDGGVLATAVHTVTIAQAAAASTSALVFDGVDNYLEVAPVGSVPAALQLSATDPFTIAAWVQVNDVNQDRTLFGSVTFINSKGYRLAISNSRPVVQINGTGGLKTASVPSNLYYTLGRGVSLNRWVLVVGTYDGVDTLKIFLPNDSSLPAGTAVITSPGLIDYSTSGTYAGVYRTDLPTAQLLNGRIGAIGMWSTDQSANVADIYANGKIIDWSTLANPPDLAHYKIESTDDPTASGGIADSSGNGFDGTMQNAIAGDLVTVTPGWSA
jgi:hypothetical protein